MLRREIWKRSFIFTVGPTVHTNPAKLSSESGAFRKREQRRYDYPISSPEVALLLISTTNCDLWEGPTLEVRDS